MLHLLGRNNEVISDDNNHVCSGSFNTNEKMHGVQEEQVSRQEDYLDHYAMNDSFVTLIIFRFLKSL